MVTICKGSEVQDQLMTGLSAEDCARLNDALSFAETAYADKVIETGQPAIDSSKGIAGILAVLNSDAQTRIAGLLAELPGLDATAAEKIEERFGPDVAGLMDNIRQLLRLRELTSGLQEVGRGKNAVQLRMAQAETLRKMLLAMASDMRVVLIRLATRVTTLRYFAENKRQDDFSRDYARETLDLYAPLANRLGIWQMKWELEDLSFRFLEPETYKQIARMLEEKRIEREEFIRNSVARVKAELSAVGIQAEVSGRPKHIFSIWNKMRGKDLDFSKMHDLRAVRVIVPDVKTCFAALGVVHTIWTPVLEEFDDYISRPKPNGYQSLHTVITAENGQTLEVQIRTEEMHNFAEYGVAAHWRYKEAGGSNFARQKYDEKISWLRQLLAWKTEVAETVAESQDDRRDLVEKIKSTTLDDRIYILTPHARVIDLPAGSTPIDFAYHLHSDVGHRCRGARVDGVMVPLNTALKNGQTVEIITAKSSPMGAGPSRDWLSPGYAASPRTHAKIRAWFNAVEHQETVAAGRTLIEKTLQREGKTAVNLEDLARKLGFTKVDEFFLAVGKDKFSLRSVEQALHGEDVGKETKPDDIVIARKSRATSVAQGAKSGVLVVGTAGLLTQMAKCCKPAPPDPIVGFVTRGKGISIHRVNCKNFAEMRIKSPERVIQTAWGEQAPETVFPVDIFVMAGDRPGLLRDVSEIFTREKINVIGVHTQSSKGQARMSFTAEIASTEHLQKALGMIREVAGVQEAKRQ
jgi:GTP pyrophosphokinase